MRIRCHPFHHPLSKSERFESNIKSDQTCLLKDGSFVYCAIGSHSANTKYNCQHWIRTKPRASLSNGFRRKKKVKSFCRSYHNLQNSCKNQKTKKKRSTFFSFFFFVLGLGSKTEVTNCGHGM